MLIGYYLPVLIYEPLSYGPLSYEPLIYGPLNYERLSYGLQLRAAVLRTSELRAINYGLSIMGYQLRAINYGLSITGYQLRAISYGLYSPERAACISQHLGLGNVH